MDFPVMYGQEMQQQQKSNPMTHVIKRSHGDEALWAPRSFCQKQVPAEKSPFLWPTPSPPEVGWPRERLWYVISIFSIKGCDGTINVIFESGSGHFEAAPANSFSDRADGNFQLPERAVLCDACDRGTNMSQIKGANKPKPGKPGERKLLY